MKIKILAIVGTVLVWITLLAPVLLSLVVLLTRNMVLFDYLMPAELFPLALIGGGFLYLVAYRIHYFKRMISWSLSIAIVSLVSGQIFAVISGVASGSIDTWQLFVIRGTNLLYCAFLFLTGINGIRLLLKIFTDNLKKSNFAF
jgi:hypothetical protein